MEVSNEFRFVLVGKTGTGRSSIGNSILRKNVFRKYVSSVSVTDTCISGEAIRNKAKIIVVDTPGLFHTNIRQDAVKKEISKCMDILPYGPHAFLYDFRITRHSKEEKQTLVELEDIFGGDFFRYCILLFIVDNPVVNDEIGGIIETVPHFYHDLVDRCNGRVITVCEDAKSSKDVFVQIIRFQQEIAKQEPPYYSRTMLSNSKSRLFRMLVAPAKSILCWLKQRKIVNILLFALIFGGVYYHFVYNSQATVLPEATTVKIPLQKMSFINNEVEHGIRAVDIDDNIQIGTTTNKTHIFK